MTLHDFLLGGEPSLLQTSLGLRGIRQPPGLCGLALLRPEFRPELNDADHEAEAELLPKQIRTWEGSADITENKLRKVVGNRLPSVERRLGCPTKLTHG
jgi:hypothetical protein